MNKTLASRNAPHSDAGEKTTLAATPFFRRLMCWEGFLLVVTLLVFGVNALASPYFLNIWNLSDATFNFTEKAIIVLPMAMLIIAREIDLSVASTMALSSTVMGFCAQAGFPTPALVGVVSLADETFRALAQQALLFGGREIHGFIPLPDA